MGCFRTMKMALGAVLQIRIMSITALCLSLLSPSHLQAGGFGQVLSISFDPIMQSKNGRIDNCGVHFKAAIQQGDRMFAILGSFNEHYFKNQIPSISAKILAQEFRNGNFVLSRLSGAFVRGQDFSTADFHFNMLSEETGAWLAMTDMGKKPNLFPVFILSLAERPWVGFNLGDGGLDITFQLPKPKEASLFKDVRTCSLQAIKQVQRELVK
jgi:hypothetical protein